MDLFRLELFSPGEVYFSGQEIQGQIHIHLSGTGFPIKDALFLNYFFSNIDVYIRN